MRAFANLPIKTKIVSGFAGMLVILGGALWISHSGGQAVERAFGEYAHRVGTAAAVSQVELEFQQLRRVTREYALQGAQQDADAALAMARTLRATIDHAAGQIRDPSRAAKIEQVGKLYDR
jgi:CHASE3 domain sensor protein